MSLAPLFSGPVTGIFTGALLIAGAFTFLPARIMHAVAFGQ